MKKSVKMTMIIIAACIVYQLGYLTYCQYKTEPIRKNVIAYVRGAVKNEAISREEGRRYVRFMQHSSNYVSVELCKMHARMVRKEVSRAYQLQYDEQAQRQYKALAPAMTCYRTIKVED